MKFSIDETTVGKCLSVTELPPADGAMGGRCPPSTQMEALALPLRLACWGTGVLTRTFPSLPGPPPQASSPTSSPKCKHTKPVWFCISDREQLVLKDRHYHKGASPQPQFSVGAVAVSLWHLHLSEDALCCEVSFSLCVWFYFVSFWTELYQLVLLKVPGSWRVRWRSPRAAGTSTSLWGCSL